MLKIFYIILFVSSLSLAADKYSDPTYRGTIYPKNFDTTLDFEWSGNLPVVHVTIEGKAYRFLFDTAAPTILPEKLIKELKLQPLASEDTLNDSSGEKLQTKLYTLPHLKVGGIDFRDFTILSSNFTTIFPLSCLRFDGVLGYNYLQYLIVKLDMKNQKIILSDKIMNHKDYTAVDIEFEPRYGPLVTLNFAFGNAPFQIDTGSNGNIQLGTTSVIPEMGKFKYLSRDMRGVFIASIGGAKQNNRTIDYLVTDFSIDNKIPIKAFPVSVNQSDAFLIGENFLKKFTTIIDFPAKKAYFKANEKGDIKKGFDDTFGFTPMWDGKSGLYISAVSSNTAAANAGLKPGDKIFSLNGKKMNSFTEDRFCKFILNSQDNPNSYDKQKSLTLVIQHENQKEQKFQLKKR